jgi:methylmalonyl-CoA mutase
MDMAAMQQRCNTFLKTSGRRPRILLTSVEKKISARIIKAFAIFYADAGCDVDIGPEFASFKMIARMAIENDVHVVGLLGSTACHKDSEKKIQLALSRFGANEIKIITAKEQIDGQLKNSQSDFEKLAARTVKKTLETLGE